MDKKIFIKRKFEGYLNIGTEQIEGSSFETLLFKLIMKADYQNMSKLYKSFPLYVEVVAEYQGNWKGLQKRINESKEEIPDEITDYMNIISKETAKYLYENELEKVLFIDDDFQESYVSDIKQFDEYYLFAVDKKKGEIN